MLSEHEVLTFAKVLADRDEGFIELAYQETGEEGRPLGEGARLFFEKVAEVSDPPSAVPDGISQLRTPRTAPRAHPLARELR